MNRLETHPTPAHRRAYLAALRVLRSAYLPAGITEPTMRRAYQAARETARQSGPT